MVVMINEPTNAKLVKEDVLTERQCFTNQIGTALAQGVVKSFDVGGFPSLFANGTMALGG